MTDVLTVLSAFNVPGTYLLCRVWVAYPSRASTLLTNSSHSRRDTAVTYDTNFEAGR